MHEKTVQQHADALKKGEYSSVELTKHYLERIKQHTSLNAFITTTESQALEQAALADKRIQSGDATTLTGIPIAQKDIFCTKIDIPFLPPSSADLSVCQKV